MFLWTVALVALGAVNATRADELLAPNPVAQVRVVIDNRIENPVQEPRWFELR